MQVNTAGYRAPGQFPDGAVLVVGSAQSGCQITEDLLAAGRRVLLATSRVGRLPFRHRGRETVEWLVEAGFMDQRPADLPDPSAMGCAGCAAAAPGSCSASPGTPPWSPTRSGPTWAAEAYRKAARPSAW
ncbi:MAG: hypothetical protein ACJ75A_24215 [Actinomycetes bacterium]